MNKTEDTKRIIVALDFPDESTTLALLDKLDASLCRVKIGKELFTRCGPALVQRIVNDGFDVFLDLKFHDIPNTVAGAVKAAADLGVWMVNVHASGGEQMMVAAHHALEDFNHPPLLIGVTVLTSLSDQDLKQLGVETDTMGQVLRLATLSANSGLDGVVCSARETRLLREKLPDDFLLVTPGIRPGNDDAGDQKRVVLPGDAIAAGSSYLVIGRPITQAVDPVEKLRQIQSEISAKF